jgi:hypothetical protein
LFFAPLSITARRESLAAWWQFFDGIARQFDAEE